MTWDRYRENNRSDLQVSHVQMTAREAYEAGAEDFLSDLADEIRTINAANGWNVFQHEGWADQYRIPAILALIHSEVSEALEAFRINDKEGFVEEMADTVIRVLDVVGGIHADFRSVIESKLEKNKQRGYRHGGKRV